MEPQRIMQSSMDDIIFENRNKSYGAYILRKLYPKNLGRSVLAAVIFFTLAITGPVLASLIMGSSDSKKENVVEVTLEAPPDLDPNKPPPPPPPPPPPKAPEPPPPTASIKYVPPKVVEDKKVVEEEPPPKQEDMKDIQVSTETKEGVKGNAPVMLDEGKGDGPPVEEKKEPEIFNRVEQMPEFPGGEAALKKWLSENIKYPEIAKENGIDGTVVVSFVVDESGNINVPTILKGLGGGLNEESIRVVKKMPKWNAGKQQGRAVKVKFNLPIKYKLQ